MKLNDIVKPISSQLKLSEVNSIGKYIVYGASGKCGYIDSFKVDKNYVALVKDGAGVGHVYKLKATDSFLGTMQGLVPNDNIDRDYVYYLIRYLDLGAKFNGATIPHIYFKNYGNETIKNIDYQKQVLISKELSKIEDEIFNKKKQFLFLDELVKSRFIEMFKKYNKVELHTISKITMGQSPDSSSYNDEGNGTPFFQGKGDYGDKYTVVKHYTTSPKKIAKKDSVLMSVRAPVGPVNIANTDCCIGRGLCSIDAIEGQTNNEFIYNALNAMQDEISGKGNGSTFKAINKDDVYKLHIPSAPIDEQNDFSNFVKLIDKSKFIVQQEIKDLQELLDKKMDDYFGQ